MGGGEGDCIDMYVLQLYSFVGPDILDVRRQIDF